MTAPHIPVLLAETLAALAVQPGETYVDATLGAGGYLRAVRLELEEDCPPDIAQMLLQKFQQYM